MNSDDEDDPKGWRELGLALLIGVLAWLLIIAVLLL